MLHSGRRPVHGVQQRHEVHTAEDDVRANVNLKIDLRIDEAYVGLVECVEVVGFERRPLDPVRVVGRAQQFGDLGVGDTLADIGAAKAAGLALSIGITHGFGTREVFEAAGADRVIDSLRELPAIISSAAS